MLRIAALLLLAMPAVCMAAAPTWQPQQYSQAIMLGVDFVDENTGYIAGGDNGIGASMIKSTDGGVNWEVMPIHEPALMFAAVAASSPTSIIANGIGLVGFGGCQYSNDGNSFTNSSEVYEKLVINYQQSQSASVINGAEESFAIVGSFGFWNETAHANFVGISADSGATFNFAPLPTPVNVPARYSAFPSTSVGFITSGCWPPNDRRTLSNQRHLSARIHVHVDGDAQQSIHVTPEQQLNRDATGWVGIIQRSTDGFQTWTTVFQNDTYYFNQIECASEQVCWAIAENYDYGYVFKTADGGDTWEQQMEVTGISLMAVKTLSEDEAWVGGGLLAQSGINGTAYHTTDGGATWSVDNLPGFYLMDFAFISPTQGWAVAANIQGTSNVLIYA